MSKSLQAGHALEQIVQILDRPIGQRSDDLGRFFVEAIGHEQPQRHLVGITQVERQALRTKGPAELPGA